jgi:dihydroflavonol-4-reductase
MATAYVTGASGFLGAHVERRLVETGWDVISLVRKPLDEPREGVRYVLGDVTDYDALTGSIPKHCDAVFHLAADTTHWHAVAERQNEINVGGTRKIALASLAAEVKRFVHCSSDAAWGLQIPVLREDVPRRGMEEPINYQRSKYWAEEEVRCIMNLGLDAVMVNPTNVLGTGAVKGWSHVAVQIHQGFITIAPPGAGAFAYADDTADAMIAAASLGQTGHNYLLGGVNATYLEFMQACARAVGREFPANVRSVESLLAEAEVDEAEGNRTGVKPRLTMDYALVYAASLEVDSSKAIRELGFRVRPLDEIVGLTVDWLRDNGFLK